jgi:transcriptional regulator with XRE-family HTH domain
MRTLRELREAAGLTQLALANRLEVTPGTVYNWERGRGEPRASQVAPLADALGVSRDEALEAIMLTMEAEEGKAAA